MQALFGDHAVEHLGGVETVHHHEPVDDFAGTADGEPGRRALERNNVAIDVGSQAAIEPQLGTARRLATIKRREIEIRETNRLLELVGAAVGEKNLRHMRLATDHLARGRPIGVTAHQKLDLVGERRLGTSRIFRARNGWRLCIEHGATLELNCGIGY